MTLTHYVRGIIKIYVKNFVKCKRFHKDNNLSKAFKIIYLEIGYEIMNM